MYLIFITVILLIIFLTVSMEHFETDDYEIYNPFYLEKEFPITDGDPYYISNDRYAANPHYLGEHKYYKDSMLYYYV